MNKMIRNQSKRRKKIYRKCGRTPGGWKKWMAKKNGDTV